MKRYIKSFKSSDKPEFNNKYLVSLLKDHSIDTTKHKYELRAQTYERYESGKYYTKKFTCPGDWLAYLSMIVHASPSADNIADELGIDYFEEILEDNPTVADIEELASSTWWGDGDDFIIYLKNLDSGEYLYGPEEEEEEDIDEEDWGD